MFAWLKNLLPKTDTGARGERQAAAHLQKKNYRIIARNWRNPRDRRDELDLVCLDAEILVFVEVKTRSFRDLVSGYHAVNARKKTVLLRAAKTYLRLLDKPPPSYRLDIIEVTTRDKLPPEIRHYENVPLFPKNYRL